MACLSASHYRSLTVRATGEYRLDESDMKYGQISSTTPRAGRRMFLNGICRDRSRTPAGSLNWRHSGMVMSNVSASSSGRARFPLSVSDSIHDGDVRISVRSPPAVRSRTVSFAGALLAARFGTLAGCGGDGDVAGGRCGARGRGGPAMAVPVEMVTLAETPIEQIGEFVGTIKSRRSTTIQPQAEGFLLKILVKSGDRVTAGTPMFEIDAAPLQAAIVGPRIAVRAAREADAKFARQQAERAKQLLAAGAMSQQEFDQAHGRSCRRPRRSSRRSTSRSGSSAPSWRTTRVWLADGRRRRRRPGPPGRSRHAVDGADDGRGQHRPRGLRERAGAGGAAAQGRAAGADPRRGRQADRDRAGDLRLAVGRRRSTQTVLVKTHARRASRRGSGPISSCARRSCSRPAGDHGAGRRGQPHQRACTSCSSPRPGRAAGWSPGSAPSRSARSSATTTS